MHKQEQEVDMYWLDLSRGAEVLNLSFNPRPTKPFFLTQFNKGVGYHPWWTW